MQASESNLFAVLNMAEALRRRIGLLVCAGGGSLLLALVSRRPYLRWSFTMAAGAIFFILVVFALAIFAAKRHKKRQARRLAQLFDADLSPSFATDPQGRIFQMNRAAQARLGGDPVKSLQDWLGEHMANPGAVMLRLQALARQNGAAREDLVTRRTQFRLSVHQIDELTFFWRVEEFLERSSESRGSEGLSIPVVTVNRNGVVLFSNDALRRLLGERPKRLDQFLMQPYFQSGQTVNLLAPEGPLRALAVELETVGERREIYFLPAPVSLDSDSPTIEFETLPVAMMKFSADGDLLGVNAAARQVLGVTRKLPGNMRDMFDDLGRPISDWLADVIQERIPCGAEVLRLRGTEEEAFVQVQLRRMVENGRGIALAILLDATALKVLEAQFNQSQKMQAIGQLAGEIAHDFNNLLTAISGHCDLLLLRHQEGEVDHDDLAQISQNASRAAALVSQLLAYSRKQTLKPERLDLQDVVTEASTLLTRLVGEKISLQLEKDLRTGPIRADRRRLEQVLVNLVVNARDAMPEGGVIKIEIEPLSLAAPKSRGKVVIPAGDYALLRVIDQGHGIDEDKRALIFEPFFTTKKNGEGTGLGLSTVYGIVKQSGGYIFVDSWPGEGASFEILFPVNTTVDPASEAKPAAKFQTVVQQKIDCQAVVLLVEDEAPVRAFSSRALRMLGFTVIEAAAGEDALELLDDPGLVVDVIVTDVVMPGLDGPSWVRAALKRRPDLRVIFVSGYAEDRLTAEQERIPNSAFLPKPFSLNDLTSTVIGHLH